MNTEIYKWGKIALIMLVVFLGVTTLNSLKSLRSIDPAYNSITVSGEGEAFEVPDIATFFFTVMVEAKEVAAVQAQMKTKVDTVLARLKDLGIEDKDIKTTDYSVYPKYVYSQVYCIQAPCPTQEKQDGYSGNHTVTVRVRNIDDAGKALAAAGDTGAATALSGLSFEVDDSDAVVAEARSAAIEDAQEKAEKLADDLGVRLVRVVSYSDSLGGGDRVYYAEASMGRGGAIDQAKAPTLPAGENKSVVTVSVTYEIR